MCDRIRKALTAISTTPSAAPGQRCQFSFGNRRFALVRCVIQVLVLEVSDFQNSLGHATLSLVSHTKKISVILYVRERKRERRKRKREREKETKR